MEEVQWNQYVEEAPASLLFKLIQQIVHQFQEGEIKWDVYLQDRSKFRHFLQQVVDLMINDVIPSDQFCDYVQFISYAVLSIHVNEIREVFSPLWNIQLWTSLQKRRLELELHQNPQYHVNWEVFQTKKNLTNALRLLDSTSCPSLSQKVSHFLSCYDADLREDPVSAIDNAHTLLSEVQNTFEEKKVEWTDLSPSPSSLFFPHLLTHYFDLLQNPSPSSLASCQAILRLLILMLSQLSTRRFFAVYVSDSHVVAFTRLSPLYQSSPSLHTLLHRLEWYLHCALNSTEVCSCEELQRLESKRLGVFQKIIFKYYRDCLEDLCLTSTKQLASRSYLTNHLQSLSISQLEGLTYRLRLTPSPSSLSKEVLVEILVSEYASVQDPILSLNETPTLPAEKEFNVNTSDLPRCSLQYVNMEDYLLRLFKIYREESICRLGEDVRNVLEECQLRRDSNDRIVCGGVSKRGVLIHSFVITQVRKATMRDDRPAEVTADVVFSIQGLKGESRRGWENLHVGDVMCLVHVDPVDPMEVEETDRNEDWMKRLGVKVIRCCEVVRMEDEGGVVLNDMNNPDDANHRAGMRRKLVVHLDALQYQQDMEEVARGGMADPYEGFNVLIRCNGSKNPFKAVLDNTLSLLNTRNLSSSLPSWLAPILLGKGNPLQCTYKALQGCRYSLEVGDLFMDAAHVRDSFPSFSIQFTNRKGMNLKEEEACPPYRLTVDEEAQTIQCISLQESSAFHVSIGVEEEEEEKKNSLRWTVSQVEAICNGLKEGVSMMISPSGTGKRSVVTELVNRLYHAHPEERILLITRSTHQLNEIFSRLMNLPIEKRHLLRLSEKEYMKNGDEYGQLGRVGYCLQRRELLLECVKRLAVSVGCVEDYGYSCETADHLYVSVILPRMELMRSILHESEDSLVKLREDPRFLDLTAMPSCFSKEQVRLWDDWKNQNSSLLADFFPFKLFFLDQQQPLLPSSLSSSQIEERVECCFASLQSLFSELREYRAFELLRTNQHRMDYVLTTQARVIGMTSAEAASLRSYLLEKDFHYDSLLVVDASEMTELETFLPLVLQKSNQLKRVVLCGDSQQLPPSLHSKQVIKYTGFNESLFVRLLHLGVPAIELDMEFASRESLWQLVSSYYPGVKRVCEKDEYKRSNGCLRYDYQCVKCSEGANEEARYIVSFYQYLRLCGYEANRVSVLSNSEEQRDMLRELFREECGKNPVFGLPNRICTIDQYQDERNDIILMSMVDSEKSESMMDYRRWVVSICAARLGLYVFCDDNILEKCVKGQSFSPLLLSRPTTLQLVENEYEPCERTVDEEVNSFEVLNATHLAQIVYYFYEERRKMLSSLYVCFQIVYMIYIIFYSLKFNSFALLSFSIKRIYYFFLQ